MGAVDLQTAAERLGVHYQTAYRWVRKGTLRAVKQGASYEISDVDLAAFAAARAEPTPPPKRASVRSWEAQVHRLHRLLVDGDELAVRDLVQRLVDGGVDVVTICDRLLAPGLQAIGDDWSVGLVSVAEEHRASAICDRLLARLAVHPRGRPRGVCVVTTTESEGHGLPAAMAAVALRADRWQVHHLGCGVPLKDTLWFVESIGADLVVLSLTNPATADEAVHAAELILDESGVRVLLGGPGRTLAELVSEAKT